MHKVQVPNRLPVGELMVITIYISKNICISGILVVVQWHRD